MALMILGAIAGAAADQRSITDVRLYEGKLEAVSTKVMEMTCGYNGPDAIFSGAQFTIDSAYVVSPPRNIVSYFRFNPLIGVQRLLPFSVYPKGMPEASL